MIIANQDSNLKTLKNFTLVSCTSLLLITACVDDQKAGVQSVQKVQVVEAKMDNVQIKKDFVGQVYGITDIPIRARLDGFLEGIHFEEGKPVEKGQLLYTIDPEQIQNSTKCLVVAGK